MALKPIKKKRLFEEVILAIEKYIQEENIHPGDKLPSENELVELFRISKTSVREAMTVLKANGVIETRSGAGIFLKEVKEKTIAERISNNLMDKNELQEILEFRRGLEIEAAALAAKRGSSEDLAVIKQANDKLIKVNSAGGLGVQEDFMFHYSIIIASHNSIYKDVFDRTADKFEEVIRVTKIHPKIQSTDEPRRLVSGHKEHEQIIEALVKKDPVMASEKMREHLQKTEKKVWTHIKK